MTALLEAMGVPALPRVRQTRRGKGGRRVGGVTYKEGDIVSFRRLEGPMDAALVCCRMRLLFMAGMFVLGFMVIGARLMDVMMFPEEAGEGRLQTAAAGAVSVERADIYDRQGALVATSLQSDALFANPQDVLEPERVARELVQIIPELNPAQLEAQLRSDRSFIWITRNLTPQQKYAVNSLGEPGLHFEEQMQRIYPQEALLGHVLGYVGVDNQGLAGLEKELDGRIRDVAAGPLALSIDMRVQHALHDALARGMQTYEAKAATGLVTDIRTGELLGMVSLPDFDPHHPADAASDARFNRAVTGVYEMGSTFKSFTMAMALESGQIGLRDTFDTTKPVRLARHTFRDAHPSDHWMSLPEVFMRSSNVGTVQIAYMLGRQRQQQFLERLGLMEPVSLEIAEQASPLLPERWGDIHMLTVSFGYGLSVTPLHMAQAMGAMVNGGKLVPLTLLKRDGQQLPDAEQVVSPETSQAMRAMMRQVVLDGTGKKANAEGYMVGGKTGTAEKPGSGGYNRRAMVSSFIAAFPIHDPRYLVMAMYDEPMQGEATYGRATASMTAAPTTREIITRIAPMLGVMPVRDSEALDAALRSSIHMLPPEETNHRAAF